MKNIYNKISILVTFVFSQGLIYAQCGVQQTGGTSINMFTLIRNSTSSIAANKALNTIAFIHRNNSTAFGGSSGNLRFDYSTDGGATWTLDQGNINPTLTHPARYPNIAIYNPASNTNTFNAYISYMAPTFSGTASWNGEVTGVSKLNVTGVTETYNSGGIGTSWQASSLVSGAPGVFWAVDPLTSGTGFNIYKGVWNSTTLDINWSINNVVNPTYNYLPPLTDLDINIAFDPTGQIGYFSFAGNISGGPAGMNVYPVLYKTTNGGSTWTGPTLVDLSKFSCITSNTVSPNLASMNSDHDLVVDVNGNPHIITTLGNASGYIFNYTLWHHMYDITLNSGLWVAYDLGNVNGSPNTFGVSPNFATQRQAPQAARSADGSKIFFTWTDNSSYALGAVNSTPNLFGKAYNVTNNSWTPTKDFTSCNVGLTGKILFPHIASEVLEPNSTTFKIPTVYGDPSVANDMGVTTTFRFLDNITFATSEFSLTVPPATVTIQQAPLAIICPGGSITINVAGNNAGQALWNTGAATTTLSIASGTATSYSVVAQVGCNVGTASIAVTNLTVNASPLVPSICPGNAAGFSVIGNALGYTWTPGNITGTNVTLNPLASTVTLTALGSSSCTSSQTVGITLLPVPSLSIVGSNTICAGTVLSQTVNGAQSYLWNTGVTGATFTDSPVTNTVYSVIGTAANSCTNTQSVSVVVKPSPTITAAANPTAICIGQSIFLTSNGAVSYSWNAVSSANNVSVTPTSTGVYTVTGAGANLCETSQTVNIVVYALPSLTVTPTKPLFCKGEKTRLTASGATSYTWVSPGLLTPSIQVSPTVTTTYTVLGVSSEGCSNSQTFALVVSLCTGIEQLEGLQNIGLLVYPNPNNGLFAIKAEVNLTLNIINELGQIISSATLNEDNGHLVNVEELPAGIYFIIANSDNRLVKQKIVVTR